MRYMTSRLHDDGITYGTDISVRSYRIDDATINNKPMLLARILFGKFSLFNRNPDVGCNLATNQVEIEECAIGIIR